MPRSNQIIFVAMWFTFFVGTAYSGSRFESKNCAGVESDKVFSSCWLEGPADCSAVKAIESVANQLEAFLPAPIKNATLFVHAKSYEGHADLAGLIVLNAVQLAWGTPRPFDQNEKIWSHEMGHLAFNALLVKSFEPIRGFVDYLSENKKLAILAKDPNLNTWPELKSKWSPDFGKARDLQTPYSELYADLVASLNANDPLAMQKAMVAPGMPNQNLLDTRYYAFAGDYNISNWKEYEVHFFFAPARAYIGKAFLHFPMSSAQKRKILQKVFEACASELNRLWAAGKSLPGPSEGNRKLIEEISLRFSP